MRTIELQGYRFRIVDSLPAPKSVLERVQRLAKRRTVWALERAIDLAPGFKTSQLKAPPSTEERTGYQAMLYWSLPAIYRRIRPTSSDTIFDLGCGKGRVTSWLAFDPFRRGTVKKIVGIEIDTALVPVARRNAEKLPFRGCTIEIIEGDAAEVDFSEATIVLMFHPFGPKTLRKVLDKLAALSHRLRVVYANPAHIAVFDGYSFKIVEKFSVPFDIYNIDVAVFDKPDRAVFSDLS